MIAITSYQYFAFHWRHSAWVSALLILIFNAVLYAYTGLIDADASTLGFASQMHLIGMMLLMTLLPMWLLGCFIVTQRHSLAIARRLDANLAQSILDFPWRQGLVGFGGGLAYAFAFNVPLYQVDLVLAGNGPMISVFIGQLMVWTCVGFLLAIRLYVGKQFYNLGKTIKISIFDQSSLEPFARVGMLDVVIVVGGLAIAVVQSIDAQFRIENYGTAFLVALPAGAALLVRPMWSLHKRLVERKKKLLAEVCLQIGTASEHSSTADMAVLESLLQRRDRINTIPTWPLDVAIWQRLFFYVLIPPLAWSGAAMVEVAIDKFLGL
ncbi:MAG: hypothetical protein V7742_12395 [Halioglobus sp.]